MGLLSTRLCQAALLVSIVVATGCGEAGSPASSSAPEAPLNAAAAALEPATISGSAAQGASKAQGASAAQIPGTDPAIQRWFLDNGAVKVKFNDALQGAWKAVTDSDPAGCQPLDTGTRELSTVLLSLEGLSLAGQKLAAAMRTPLPTFTAAATACLAKDFAAARIALDSGAVQQAEAQEAVDEILDGDA